MNKLHYISKYLLLVCLTGYLTNIYSQGTEKPNILFVISDDLNDYIEGYNSSLNTLTPNLNELRENGTVFLNAYASAPICAPSRTSFLTGKDLAYTNVYKNTDGDYKCKEFGDNFTVAEGNETYFTIPQYFKDSLGYFTFNLNKVFHCHKNYIEYDEDTEDPCAKSGAWNKYFYYNDSSIIQPGGVVLNQGVNGYDWAAIDDSLEQYMSDYVATDSAISFIEQFNTSPESVCNKPFLIMMGYQKPHKEQFIPEKYFLDDYITDFYATPFDLPYNNPKNNYPANGIILPPQPDTPFADLDALLTNTISPLMVKNIDTHFMNWPENLPSLPEIDSLLTDEERIEILEWSKRSNAVMAYLAAIQFVDAQFGRLYSALVDKPEILNNTIIVFIGDNGYSLSEKRHWGKYALWDTDVRVPLIIADMRNPNAQICNKTVSLLDLFPTLLDLTESNAPLFPDSSIYFDGISLVPLLQNPDTAWVRPVISATKKQESNDIGDCFPHYSVRDERFHLITYQTNGDIPGSCDSASSLLEYELYDIGTNRETDPNEWNNLANNSDYSPVINYLNQWLPNGELYKEKTYSAEIQTDLNECIITYGDTINLQIELHDTVGLPIFTPPGFNFRWTNNLTSDTLFGSSIDFFTTNIPELEFTSNSNILIYFEMIDNSNQVVAAFDIIELQINPSFAPSVSFNVINYDTNTILIEDFTIIGNYTSYYWDFGFGPIFQNSIPGPITFDEIGDYNITCYVKYGNNEDCTNLFSQPVSLSVETFFKESELNVFPNPAQTEISLLFNDAFLGDKIIIVDFLGKIVASFPNYSNNNTYQFDISNLNPGCYIVYGVEVDLVHSATFVVSR